MALSNPPKIKELDLTPPAGYADLQTWLARNFGILQVEAAHEVGEVGEPAFDNGWSNLGSPHAAASFYRDSFGLVRLQGHITGGTAAATAFALPTGYYSGFEHEFTCYGSAGGFGPGPGGSTLAIVIIDALGNVIPDVSTGADVSLDSVVFRV